MSDTIKCACSSCGAKYRLPLESQGRTAKCKKCGEKFEVPRAHTLEDSILSWLTEADPEDETTISQPRVINMPNNTDDPDASKRAKGPIRMKSGSTEPH